MDNNWYEGIEVVIRAPLLFRRKLGIGEDAYKSLSIGNAVGKYCDLLSAAGTGAAIAKSTFIASAFFQPTGLMGFLGLASASTPVGWVVFAAVAAAGAWHGIVRYYRKSRHERVETIPKFINTPINVIGVAIFNLILPLSLKVSLADGRIHDSEKERIRSYFVDEWGYDEQFYLAGYQLFLENIDKYQTGTLAKRLSEFQNVNPDCNQGFITGELIVFLEEVMDADGVRHDSEISEIELIKKATKPKQTLRDKLTTALPGWMRLPKKDKRLDTKGEGVDTKLPESPELPDIRNAPHTHERMLVELKIKINKTENDLAELANRIDDFEAQLERFSERNNQLESRIKTSRKYIYWLSIVAVFSGLVAITALLLVFARPVTVF